VALPTPPLSPPELSWDGLRSFHARARRPEPWKAATTWAIDVLQSTLGDGWAIKASTRTPASPVWSVLVSAMTHTVAASELLEWALRLQLLADVDGAGDVRRDLSRDVSVGRGLHTQLQLELAGHAHRLGWPIRLEPSGGASPGDVAFDVPDRSRIAVETKALTERERTRDARAGISTVTDRLRFAAMERGLWVAGNLRRVPSEDEVVGIERWIASTEVGGTRRLRALEGIELYLVPREASQGHVLSSPPVTDHLLPRIVR
jgi:hypothetical protein